MRAQPRRGRTKTHAPKVLMLVENRPAPDDARVWPEALALRDRGFQVSVISPKGAEAYRETHSCIDGIHIYRYDLPTGDSATAYIAEYAIALVKTFGLSLWVWLRRGFDVVHTANPPDIFFTVGWFYRLFGKRFVFDQHDLSPELFEVLFIEGRVPRKSAELLHKLLLCCEWCSYRAANLVIVTNQSIGRIAARRGGCSAQKVAVVRNGPDLRHMQPVAPDPQLKMGRRHLLAYLGVMGAQDGVAYAVHALESLVHRRGRRDVAMVLMGDGAQAPALRALVHELALEEYVRFTGWLPHDDIVRYLSVSDIGLSPDPHNVLNDASTMIKTMEYMALGKPLVAFDLTETRVTAQEAGLYATPNLAEDFANKIEALLDDEALRLRMGALGRKRIEDVLSWDHSTEHLLCAYERLLGRDMSTGHVASEATRTRMSAQNRAVGHVGQRQPHEVHTGHPA